MAKIAIIQESPIFLDKGKTIIKAVKLIEDASSNGAKLVLFPEAFIPGYPTWIWRLRPGGDSGICGDLHARLLKNSLDLSGDDIRPILDVAKKEQVTVVCGLNERDGKMSRTTIYNSVITCNDQQ